MSVASKTVTSQKKKNGLFNKFLDGIERVGNALPHPVTLFVMFCAAIILISDLCARAGVAVEFTMIDRKTLETSVQNIEAVSLMNADGLRYMLTSAVKKNFTGFAPLGTVLVAMLGVGVAEGTGFIGLCFVKL